MVHFNPSFSTVFEERKFNHDEKSRMPIAPFLVFMYSLSPMTLLSGDGMDGEENKKERLANALGHNI